jgi:hypothetical protein
VEDRNRSVSEYRESDTLKNQSSPSLFTILIGIDERDPLKVAVRMSGRENGEFVRIRLVRIDLENQEDVVPLTNISSYFPPTEEDVIEARFGKLKGIAGQGGGSSVERVKDREEAVLNETGGQSHRSIIGMGIVAALVLVGSYALHVARSRRAVPKGVLGKVDRSPIRRVDPSTDAPLVF